MRVDVLGPQRSGVVWFARMLQRAGISCEVTGPDSELTPASWSAAGDGRAFVLARDPRDTLVNFVAALRRDGRGGIAWRSLVTLLRTASTDEAVAAGILATRGGALMVRAWLTSPAPPGAVVLRYEEFHRVPEAALEAAVRELAGDEAVPAALTVLAAEKRPFGPGPPDSWRGWFSRANGRLFEETLPGLLRDCGYESDDRWWKALAERAPVHCDSELERLRAQVRTFTEARNERAALIDEIEALAARLSVSPPAN